MLEAEIAKLEVEVEVAKENEQRLKKELQRAETSDKEIIDAKLKTPLYAKLSSHHQAIKALKDKNEALKSELQTLTLLLDDLAKGYNPNYQDMAVKGAVVAYKEWRGIVEKPSAEGGEAVENTVDQLAGENTKLSDLLSEGDWDSSKLTTVLSEDLLDIMDGGLDGVPDTRRVSSATESDGGLLFRIHEYLPDGVVPYFEAMVDTLLDVLIKANVITDVKRMRPKSFSSSSTSSDAEPENISTARRLHSESTNHLSRVTSDLTSRKNKQKDFATRYGRSAEFKALENKCFSKDMGEYTYEYCFFGRAMQIPNNGGSSVSLGSFANFNPAGDRKWEEDEYWLQQIYARGQKCWNGPERSAVVDLVCGVDNEVRDVFEAEKCIYSIKVATPAVCFPPKEQQQREEDEVEAATQQQPHAVKDEL